MRKLLLDAIAALLVLASLFAPAHAQMVIPPGSTFQGTPAAGGLTPVCTTNCTITSGSTDFIGQATVTATGAIVITWAGAKNNAPFCLVTDNTTSEGVKSTATNTTLTATGGVTSDKLSWICINLVGN